MLKSKCMLCRISAFSVRVYVFISIVRHTKQTRRIERHQSQPTAVTFWTCVYLHKVTWNVTWEIKNKQSPLRMKGKWQPKFNQSLAFCFRACSIFLLSLSTAYKAESLPLLLKNFQKNLSERYRNIPKNVNKALWYNSEVFERSSSQ